MVTTMTASTMAVAAVTAMTGATDNNQLKTHQRKQQRLWLCGGSAATMAAAMVAETVMVMVMATTLATATATVMAMAMATMAATETVTVTAVVVVALAAAEAGDGWWNTTTNTMTLVSISLKELLTHDRGTLNAFGGGNREVARVLLADYLVRRLHTLILPRMHDNVSIKAMAIGRHCRCCGGGRGRGGDDDACGGRLSPTTPFALERTSCCVSSLLSGAGQMPTLEVIPYASSVVLLSSKSAAPVTVPADGGIRSAGTSAAWEELTRAEQRI